MGYILNRKEFLLEKFVKVGENTEITDNEKVAVIGGADSVDKWARTENVSWWMEETVTAADAEKLIENTKDLQDVIILSHDAPAQWVGRLKTWNGINAMNHLSESPAPCVTPITCHLPGTAQQNV